MYDMDMRDYDPAIARWVVQDPVVHYDYSPYSAFDNNPVYWADPSGADSETREMDIFGRNRFDSNGMYVPMHERGSTSLASFDYASSFTGSDNGGGNKDGSEKSSNNTAAESSTEEDAVAQVGLLAESFDFQVTTSNWQAAGVTGLRLTITNPKRKTTVVEFEIEVGIPLKLKNGTMISERIAQLASAEAANETAATIATLADLSNGKFYDAPALVKATFAKLMQKNLNNSLSTMLELPKGTTAGARVNSSIQSNIKTKEAVWARVTTLEALKVWVNSFF